MVDWKFDTPGRVDHDVLASSVLRAWDAWHRNEAISNMDEMRKLLAQAGARDPLTVTLPYANPAAEPLPNDRSQNPVGWDGFPKRLTDLHDDPDVAEAASEVRGYDDLGAVRLVDQEGRVVDGSVRHQQDEYLEWEAERDSEGKVVAVTLVAEGYDYWSFLFEHDPQLVVDAFRDSSQDKAVSERDLRASSNIYAVDSGGNRGKRPVIRAGRYNWRHAFNQGTGIQHLSHGANSLGAEINLAITSCLPRKTATGTLDASSRERLMCCTGGGNPNRSSDPNIAALAYGAVTDKAKPKRFTLTDPIGLYIRSFKLAAIKAPGNEDAPIELLTVERGIGKPEELAGNPEESRSTALRIRVAAPRGAGYVLGDMTINEKRITRGAQLSRLVTMHLFVDAWPAAEELEPIACEYACCLDREGQLHRVDRAIPCTDGEEAFPELRDPRPAPSGISVQERLSRRMP